MKITIITTGSRGDVEPFVALGEGLSGSGHQITIASEAGFESFIKSRGLGFARISGNTPQAINSEEGQRALQKKNNTSAFYRHIINSSAPFATEILQQCMEACKNADHIICSPYYIYLSYFISLELSKPISIAAVNGISMSFTRHFHNLLMPPPKDWWPPVAQRLYNGFSHKIAAGFSWKSFTGFYGGAWQKITGNALPKQGHVIKALSKKPPLSLYGYSATLLEKPVDWAPHQYVTGYWFLKPENNWMPPAALENFINAGPPPIYIGFGSMNNSLLKNGALEKLILEVVEGTKQRAVILKQGLNLDNTELPPNVFATEPVPFAYLFPKMSAVVHHGGAGTIGAGLLAGVPAITTPLIVDQKFWAWTLKKSGAGSNPIPWHNLSAGNLATAINSTLSNTTLRNNVHQLKRKIVTEDGVANAVTIFNRAHQG